MDSNDSLVSNLEGMIEFAKDGIVSKTLVDQPHIQVGLFCMASGQRLSRHTSSHPATILVVQGRGEVELGSQRHVVTPNSWIYMPANTPHAVKADDHFVFLLTLINPG